MLATEGDIAPSGWAWEVTIRGGSVVQFAFGLAPGEVVDLGAVVASEATPGVVRVVDADAVVEVSRLRGEVEALKQNAGDINLPVTVEPVECEVVLVGTDGFNVPWREAEATAYKTGNILTVQFKGTTTEGAFQTGMVCRIPVSKNKLNSFTGDFFPPPVISAISNVHTWALGGNTIHATVAWRDSADLTETYLDLFCGVEDGKGISFSDGDAFELTAQILDVPTLQKELQDG